MALFIFISLFLTVWVGGGGEDYINFIISVIENQI